ncbi:dihydropteroate synthase [Rosistilla carotiformis]|nr:dihydropteroate synthase [Rosistilla carotiformis]
MSPIWKLPERSIALDHGPVVMGILNVTPDSFSDGGRLADCTAAVDAALAMEDAGAGIIDIGGESTRPYAPAVDADEELQRVVPVIQRLRGRLACPISIDTSKAVVAQAAIDAGAEIINDVTGLQGDPQMFDVAARNKVAICAMHMQGSPQTMQDNPHYDDVVREIYQYLEARKQQCLAHGIDSQRICLDPGIGFGKTHQHNIALLQGAAEFLKLGVPILIGHSRKGFIGKLTGDDLTLRDAGTVGVSLAMAAAGMHILRVHNVAMTVAALKLFQQSRPPHAIEGAR